MNLNTPWNCTDIACKLGLQLFSLLMLQMNLIMYLKITVFMFGFLFPDCPQISLLAGKADILTNKIPTVSYYRPSEAWIWRRQSKKKLQLWLLNYTILKY